MEVIATGYDLWKQAPTQTAPVKKTRIPSLDPEKMLGARILDSAKMMGVLSFLSFVFSSFCYKPCSLVELEQLSNRKNRIYHVPLKLWKDMEL